MRFSNSKSLLVRSICAALIAAMLLALFTMAAFAQVSNGNTRPSDETMKSLALKYLNERNCLLVSSNPKSNKNLATVSTIKSSEMETQVEAQQKGDMEKLREFTTGMEKKGYIYWDRFETTVEIHDITVEPDKTVAGIHEYTRLYFIPGKGPDCSSFDVNRHFTFVRSGDKWTISNVKVDELGFDPPINEPSVKPATLTPEEKAEAEPPAITEEMQKQIAEANDAKAKVNALTTGISPMGSGGFNAQAVIDYCNSYWSNYNTYWYANFSPADCTNFTSQCLDQAGWIYYDGLSWDDNSWFSYRRGPGNFDVSKTFSAADRFFNHCNNRHRVGWTSDYGSLRVGDVVQIDTNQDQTIDHSMIISLITSWNVGGKFYSQHSGSRHNMPLTYALGVYPNTTHWWVLMHTY